MSAEGDTVSTDPLDEMGPIDYIVLEWPAISRSPVR